MSTAITALLFAGSMAGCESHQEVLSPKSISIDQFAQQEMAAGKIPGMSIAVVKDCVVVFDKGYGFADAERRIPAQPETIYPLGSLSKQFTAAAIMLLVQDKKLSLDDLAAPYLSSFAPPSDWQSITVRELLNQTSGIPNFLQYADITKGKSTTQRDLIDLIRNKPLAFTPGSAFQYSNTNYVLLAEVVRSVTGENVYTFLDSRIFQPLNMDSTGAYDPETDSLLRAAPYVLQSGVVSTNFPKIDVPLLVGCGGIQSSVIDLAKWDAALYGSTPLSGASKNEMWTPPVLSRPQDLNYGFGWVVDSVNGHTLIWHNGAIPGATCWMGRFKDDGITVIVLTNVFDVDHLDSSLMRIAEIGRGIAAFYIPDVQLASLAKPDPTAEVEPKQLAICKKAIADVIASRADPAMYTPDAAKALFPNAINQTGQIFRSLGPLNSFDVLSTTTSNGANEITCRLTFGATPIVYTFFLATGTNLIMGIVPSR
jgi:CubicO group peptidase (beta-lactamase class C family)